MFTRHLFFKFFLFVLMIITEIDYSIITFSKKKKKKKMLLSTLDMEPSPSPWNPRPSTLDKNKKIDSYKSCSTPAGNGRKKTINTAFASQHVPLKNRIAPVIWSDVSSQTAVY